MATLKFELGGQSVIVQGGGASTVQYDRHAEEDGRFYGIIERGGGSCELSLTVSQTRRISTPCPSVAAAENLAQAWENLAISVDDLIHEVLVPDDADRQQRESIAKVDLKAKHAPKKAHDVRVSALGTPAPAQGFQHYLVAYRTASPNIYAGGTQVYP